MQKYTYYDVNNLHKFQLKNTFEKHEILVFLYAHFGLLLKCWIPGYNFFYPKSSVIGQKVMLRITTNTFKIYKIKYITTIGSNYKKV